MTFLVGQQVVCVDASPGKITGHRDLVKGRIYKISGFYLHETDGIALYLIGVPLHNRGFATPIGWAAERFRPVAEPKTEVSFTVGADPSSDQFDNRRKVKKKVAT